MSFLWKNNIFEKPIIGEATPFDPTDFIQFLPFGGAGKTVSAGFQTIGKLFANAFKTETQLAAERLTTKGGITFVKPITPGKTTFTSIMDFFKKPLPPNITPSSFKLPPVSGGTKALIGTGIAGTTITTGFLTSPGGQEVVGVAKDFTSIGKSIAGTIQQNPLILYGIIGLGIILVIKK